jgi:hypothetical protein
MFCPNCGAHQSEGKRFCTACGTNLLLISQALLTPLPAMRDARAQEWERERAKGIKLTIIGGAFIAIQLFTFILSLPFRNPGTPFGFLSFVALALMGAGISKLLSTPRPEEPARQPSRRVEAPPPRQVFPVPPTDALEEGAPGPSVTEDETLHLPQYAPKREAQK